MNRCNYFVIVKLLRHLKPLTKATHPHKYKTVTIPAMRAKLIVRYLPISVAAKSVNLIDSRPELVCKSLMTGVVSLVGRVSLGIVLLSMIGSV